MSRAYLVTDSYIEGTTDFIFGPSIVREFVHCRIHSKADRLHDGGVDHRERNQYRLCLYRIVRVTAAEAVTRLYLGVRGNPRPGRCG